MLSVILISLALWIRTTTNTRRLEKIFADAQAVTAAVTIPRAAADAPPAICVRDFFVRIVAVSAVAETLSPAVDRCHRERQKQKKILAMILLF